MGLDKYNHIHFVGIKGVGMTGLALIAKEMGKVVTGSDVAEEFITQKVLEEKKIKIINGFNINNITKDIDLVITTGAHQGYDNPEVKKAKQLGINVISHAEALGFFMQKKKVRISVAGTHGKTTATAMIAHILSNAGADPCYTTGTGSVASLSFPAHWGKGDYFIAEADEYVTEPKNDLTPRFLWQNPNILVITNIEFDHPDVFKDIAKIRQAFINLANKMPDNRVIIASIDSAELEKALKKVNKRILWYGYSPRAEYRIQNYSSYKTIGSLSSCRFTIAHNKKTISNIEIGVSGRHNASNAAAALLASIEAGLSWKEAYYQLANYIGSGRRFEFVKKINKTLIYDDYAHHPTEINATLKNAREIFPDKKIIAVFQPHTYTRTRALFDEFARAFTFADKIVITDIFSSAREEKDPSVSSKKLASEVQKYKSDVTYSPKLKDVIKYLKGGLGKDQIIITMGAGDVYKINEKL